VATPLNSTVSSAVGELIPCDDRRGVMNRLSQPLYLVALLLASAVAACSSASVPGAVPSSDPLASPSAAPSGAAAPSAAAPSGPAGTITTPEQAVAAVGAFDPRFAKVQPYNPDMIGQCCFSKVATTADGWTVTIEYGWGDCPAGCIARHQWTFKVTPSGVVTLTAESGPPVPSGVPGGS
jgi:hypothetical protein